jgi:putative PIN family toxin of toxin-antitoxin system
MPKVVIDTSVFIAALLSKSQTSTPNQVLQAWRQGKFTLVMAPQLLQELVAKLLYLKVRDRTIEDLVVIIAEISLHISGAYEATKLDKIDPDDNKFLAAIYESKADYLISLDNHLLSLKYYHGTQILTPHLFLTALSSLS